MSSTTSAALADALWAAWQEATAGALKAREEAIEAAWKAYDEAVWPAWEAYLDAAVGSTREREATR